VASPGLSFKQGAPVWSWRARLQPYADRIAAEVANTRSGHALPGSGRGLEEVNAAPLNLEQQEEYRLLFRNFDRAADDGMDRAWSRHGIGISKARRESFIDVPALGRALLFSVWPIPCISQTAPSARIVRRPVGWQRPCS
jgi:hypothetical protein